MEMETLALFRFDWHPASQILTGNEHHTYTHGLPALVAWLYAAPRAIQRTAAGDRTESKAASRLRFHDGKKAVVTRYPSICCRSVVTLLRLLVTLFQSDSETNCFPEGTGRFGFCTLTIAEATLARSCILLLL